MDLSNLEIEEDPILKRPWSDEREFWEKPSQATRAEILLQLIDAGYINLEQAKEIIKIPSLPEPEVKQQLIQKDREYFQRIYDAELTWEDDGGRPIRTENADGTVTLNYPATWQVELPKGYTLDSTVWMEYTPVKAGGNPPFKIPDIDKEDEELWWVGRGQSFISEEEIKVWKKPEYCTCAVPKWINVGLMSQLWHCKSCDRPKKEEV